MKVPVKIVSGAQTGADRGGLDAAIKLCIPYGGFVPAGYKAEDGKIPLKYTGLTPTKSDGYLVRTRLNAQHSTATVIFTFGQLTGGSLKTKMFCNEYSKPCIHIDLKTENNVRGITRFKEWLDSLNGNDIVLNVAGNRESKARGIQRKTYEFLVRAIEENKSELDKLP